MSAKIGAYVCMFVQVAPPPRCVCSIFRYVERPTQSAIVCIMKIAIGILPLTLVRNTVGEFIAHGYDQIERVSFHQVLPLGSTRALQFNLIYISTLSINFLCPTIFS